ncbi:Bifunctional purine biosynthesis protein PurH [Mucor velutinosus]|uniref:Bifunctional purine biosynthesis protein PurH n=1 Tax=Mucor velutinosus TaxID=708070 RepID=A0AAN7DG36_9FUNG|nr:Bifunctional purine biosynthesis protein PurH [Mucor velutinosus]
MSTATATMRKSANEPTKTKSSSKRPRAPIACFRCHHKKVRCDGAHPNCTRCLSTGVLCAYPSSRRSRTTQPTNVDPFIDNLSHLEARIRRIESDLANQRSIVYSIVSSPMADNSELESKMIKTELEVQDSRSILAQLRLRGEQRISRSKRAADAAAAAAAATANSNANVSTTSTTAVLTSSLSLPLTKEEKTNKQLNTKSLASTKRTTPKSSKSAKPTQSYRSHASHSNTFGKSNDLPTGVPSSFYFQDLMLDNTTDLNCYDGLPAGHGVDWTLFDQQDHTPNAELHQPTATSMAMMASSSSSNLFAPKATAISEHNQLMVFHHHQQQQQQDHMKMEKSPLSSTRSSSLASHLGGYPFVLQPSNSTNSVNSNATALSSTTSCTSLSSACDNIFNFNMDDMMLQHHHTGQQDAQTLANSHHGQMWY